MLKTFRKIRSEREDVKQLQDAVANSFQQIVNKEILDGQILEGVVLVGSAYTLVEHKLGRAIRGFFVVRSDGAYTTVYESLADNPAPTKFLRLFCDQDRTFSLWVF